MGRSEDFSAGAGEHEVLYHLTDKPKFKLNPKKVPQDNAIAIHTRSSPGLFLTDSPERWVHGHGYLRPYVAEVHVPKGVARDERWGGEKFVPAEHFDKVHVHRVIPIDAHVREEYGAHGWVEEHHGTTFDTGEPIHEPHWNAPREEHYPFKGYRYSGPDVREMTPEQHKLHLKRARQALKGMGG